MEDLELLLVHLQEQGAEELVFLDPSFNHRPEFDLLLQHLKGWMRSGFAEVRGESLSPQQALALKEAGFDRLELGLQSINPRTLAGIKRGGDPHKVLRSAQRLKALGLNLLVDLIIGLPGDSADDIRRGFEALLRHDLAEEAQIFPLSVLPGTALRARSKLRYQRRPPYQIQGTALLDEEEIAGLLLEGEQILDQRLDESLRPHLVASDPQRLDSFHLNLDEPLLAPQPGAAHCTLWLEAEELFSQRRRLRAALEARLSIDPYCSLDVVLAPQQPFPLDLLDLIRGIFKAAPQHYNSRRLNHRGEDAARRLCLILPRRNSFGPDELELLSYELPIFRRMSSTEALQNLEALGTPVSALIETEQLEEKEWRALQEADPEAICFRSRILELRWCREVLGLGG